MIIFYLISALFAFANMFLIIIIKKDVIIDNIPDLWFAMCALALIISFMTE